MFENKLQFKLASNNIVLTSKNRDKSSYVFVWAQLVWNVDPNKDKSEKIIVNPNKFKYLY